jgi:peptide deformylase
MPILPIIKHPHPILRKKTEKIKNPLAEDVQKLIKDMTQTLRGVKGLGLAAPQVGSSMRLCIVADEGKIFALINPAVKSRLRKKLIMEEGCLSLPGKFFPVARSEKIKVRYLNEAGKKAKMKAEGFLARALQHEIDHLDGILIIDHIKK